MEESKFFRRQEAMTIPDGDWRMIKRKRLNEKINECSQDKQDQNDKEERSGRENKPRSAEKTISLNE